MSAGTQRGAHSDGQRQAAELRNGPAHAAEVASLQRLEESPAVHQRSQFAHRDGVNEHGIVMFGHDEIAELAHRHWQVRGCPEGSPEVDWNLAAQELRARHNSSKKCEPLDGH
jgi:hypothetical protein